MIHVRSHSSFQILIEALTCKVILLNMAYSTCLQTDVTLYICPPSLILCFPCCITFFSSTLLLLLIQLLNIIYAMIYCILCCGYISLGASCKLNYISFLSQSFHKWKWLLSQERQLKVMYLLLLKWSRRVKPKEMFGASTKKKSNTNGEMQNSLWVFFSLLDF